MCRKLLPDKTAEQEKINPIRCEEESKALMLKLANETHKQTQAKQKMNDAQRTTGRKKHSH